MLSLKKIKDTLTSLAGKYKSNDFLEAVLWGCARIAAADGSVSKEEIDTTLAVVKADENLKVFDSATVATRFVEITENFKISNQIGNLQSASALKKIAHDKDQGQMVIAVCCAIAASDGDFDADEKKQVQEISELLGL